MKPYYTVCFIQYFIQKHLTEKHFESCIILQTTFGPLFLIKWNFSNKNTTDFSLSNGIKHLVKTFY